MEKKRRFVSTTDEEMEQKRLKMNAQKNINQNIAAYILLSSLLQTLMFSFLLCLKKSFFTVLFQKKI